MMQAFSIKPNEDNGTCVQLTWLKARAKDNFLG